MAARVMLMVAGSSLLRAGSGDKVSLGGCGRGGSRCRASAGVGLGGVWWGSPCVALVVWLPGGGGRGMCWGGTADAAGGGGRCCSGSESERPAWACLLVCVRVVRVSQSLAGRTVRVGGGGLGIRVGLWFVGAGLLLVGGDRRQELRWTGLPVEWDALGRP